MKTLSVAAKDLADTRFRAKILRSSLKDANALMSALRADVKAEKVAVKAAKASAKIGKAKALKAARVARIAKLEARLESLRAKAFTPKARKRANRKASKVTVIVANGEAVAA